VEGDAGGEGGVLVIPATFEYVRASSLDEAIDLLGRSEEARVLAGGQSLIPLMRFRLASPGTLVDIGGLRELSGISHEDGGWRIGATTTYRQVLDDDALCGAFPLLRDCVEGIGDVQIRNRGTVGGALAHADPVSDLPALALALDGVIVARGPGGEREIAAADFFTGAFSTALGEGEVVVALRLPDLPAGAGTAWEDLEQPASGYSICGVAAVVGDVHGVLGSATMSHVRVAVTGVGEAHYRATVVEEALVGTACTAADVASAASHATDGQAVNADIHADAEYRSALAETLVRRALEQARARTG
jgi:carbon-monoxide dehydrogenase medium subunit